MDGGEKVSGGFVVTRGDGPKLLEFGKEVLDGVPCLVERFVIPSLLFAVLLRGITASFPAASRGSRGSSTRASAS